MTPQKRNKQHQGLPRNWRQKHGAYYYRVPKRERDRWDGKTEFRLGKTLAEAYRTYADWQEVAVRLSKKKKTSHVLHLLLSVITAGVWVFVWVLCGISNSMENSRIDRQIAKGKKP
jgi:hypothetical protein